MANKRQLKKQIRTLCGELAGECVLAAELIPGTDRIKFNEIISELASLQATTLSRVSIVFDKSVKSFESPAAYKAAKEAFFAQAMRKLNVEFTTSINAIVKQMNTLLTAEQRELNKTMAN